MAPPCALPRLRPANLRAMLALVVRILLPDSVYGVLALVLVVGVPALVPAHTRTGCR